MNATAGPPWLRARDLLEPIVEQDSLPEKREQIDVWLRQVIQYEFCRRLKVSAPSDSSRDSEIQRLVRGTFDKYAHGEISVAIQQLEAVKQVISDESEFAYLSQFLVATLQDWSSQQNVAGRQQLLSGIADRADEMIEERDDVELIRDSLEAALTLYGDDASVSAEVDRCRQILNSLPASE